MSAHEYDYEPVEGLPERLPEGETMLWQGAPDWATFAVHALHVRMVTLYFGIVTIAQPFVAAAGAPGSREALARATGEALWTALLGLIAVGLLCAYAVGVARTTRYTITNKRLVIRAGVAIAKAINLPFSIIQGASLRAHSGGAGDIAVQLKPDAQASYLLLWPHVRPWRWSKPEPMIRAILGAQSTATVLAHALSQRALAETQSPTIDARPPNTHRPSAEQSVVAVTAPQAAAPA